jgi:cytochrome P450
MRERWQVQRRVLAPLFTPRTVMEFAPAMLEGARALVGRWARTGAEGCVDVAAEMSRLTLEILERTIFSDGLVLFFRAILRHDEFRLERHNLVVTREQPA